MPPPPEHLLDLLDPDRDYGERTYAQVVTGVKSGLIVIEPGFNLPVLRDAETRRAIKGTGRPPGGESPSRWGRNEFAKRASDDFEAAYNELRAAMQRGDMKAHRLFWDKFLGRDDVARPDEHSDVVRELLEAARTMRPRQVQVEQIPEYIDVEAS